MRNQEIKARVKELQEIVSTSQQKIETLRSICKHEKTFKGNYSWRVGVIEERDICEFCGEVIK